MAECSDDLKEEIHDLREEVLEYEPGNAVTCADKIDFPDNLYIGLFGRTGCGKTSLINSLKFAAHGKLRRSQWLQAAGQEKAGGHTMFRKIADITKKIFVIDNRGLDDPNTEDAIRELAAQLDGERGYSECIEWQGNDDDDEGLGDIDLKAGHPIASAVFVFSARHDIDTNTSGLMEVVDFLHSHQGRYPVATITHVDVAERKHVENLKTVLRVSGIGDIFEVANVTIEKNSLEHAYQHSLLSFLERCITEGNETLVFKHYQCKEQQRKKEIERKKEENRRKEEDARRAEEMRQMAEREEREERERVERENQWKREIEENRREMERQRQWAEEQERESVERENQWKREIEESRREMERQQQRAEEPERWEQQMERHFHEALRYAERDIRWVTDQSCVVM